MTLHRLRLLALSVLCLGLLGSTVDGLALAGLYDGGNPSAVAEMAADVACTSTHVVRVASRTDADATASPLVFSDDTAESTHRQLLRTSPRPSATWRSRMLNARRAQTGRSK